MKLFLGLSLLLLAACGKGPNTIDPAFQVLYNQFLSDASTNGVTLGYNQGLTIQFATLEQQDGLGEEIGDCSNVGWGNSIIQVDTNFWNSANLANQTVLLYHELGHCLLDEIHTTNRMAIMNPLINNPVQFYPGNMSGMINEFFLDEGDGK